MTPCLGFDSIETITWKLPIVPVVRIVSKFCETAEAIGTIRTIIWKPGLKQIHKFSFKDVIFVTKEYKMYLKTFQKLGCLVAFQNRPSAPIGCEENFVNFEFLGGQFCKEKPSFVHWKKSKHSFELSLPFSVSFSGVFLALTWETLVFSCKPPPEIRAVSLLSHFWGFFSRPHSFVWTTWPEPLWLRGVMRPRD